MSNIELHNSYKCYDTIPTPPDGDSSQCNDHRHQPTKTFAYNSSNIIRSTSLDSLINSSEHDSSLEELSDSDSLCELKNIIPDELKSSEKHRRSDIEELGDVKPSNEPVITAYLAKSHKTCDYENCGFKTKTEETCLDEEAAYVNSLKPSSIVKSNRRNSVANLDSIRRMETILEEPIETKISVKEILARFETMRETAEVILMRFEYSNKSTLNFIRQLKKENF